MLHLLKGEVSVHRARVCVHMLEDMTDRLPRVSDVYTSHSVSCI